MIRNTLPYPVTIPGWGALLPSNKPVRLSVTGRTRVGEIVGNGCIPLEKRDILIEGVLPSINNNDPIIVDRIVYNFIQRPGIYFPATSKSIRNVDLLVSRKMRLTDPKFRICLTSSTIYKRKNLPREVAVLSPHPLLSGGKVLVNGPLTIKGQEIVARLKFREKSNKGILGTLRVSHRIYYDVIHWEPSIFKRFPVVTVSSALGLALWSAKLLPKNCWISEFDARSNSSVLWKPRKVVINITIE